MNAALDIRELCAEDVAAVARLHGEALPDDFLPSLGRRFLERVYYRAALRNPYGKVLVAAAGGEVAGFADVTHRPEATFGWTVRHSLPQTALAALALLGKPRRLGEAVRIVTTPRPDFGHPVGEISFIAVAPRYRGRGVGESLIRAASRYLARHGLGAAVTKTLQSNENVIRLYAKLGAKVRFPVTIGGKEYVFLEWPLPLHEGPRP